MPIALVWIAGAAGVAYVLGDTAEKTGEASEKVAKAAMLSIAAFAVYKIIRKVS